MRSPLPVLFLLGAIVLPFALTAMQEESPAAAHNAGPESCISVKDIRKTHVRDDRTIDFELNDRSVMRNTLPYTCPQLGFEGNFSYTTTADRLCSTDVITVLVTGNSRGASCGLGAFRPLPAKAKSPTQ